MKIPLDFTAANRIIDVTPGTVIFWHRRDLRLDDNAGLYHALKEGKNVLPLFIFDSNILDLPDVGGYDDLKFDARVEFIHDCLRKLKTELEDLGSSLLVLCGDPVEIFKTIRPKSVFTNHDYEPNAIGRDEAVGRSLLDRGIPLRTYKDQVIFEKYEVVKEDGRPYMVFTPYYRKWRSILQSSHYRAFPTKKLRANFKKCQPLPFPGLDQIGFTRTGIPFPDQTISADTIRKYHLFRDLPAIRGTSRLSVHLRFGTISIRRLVGIAIERNETWLKELIWRDFFSMILWHYPHVAKSSFRKTYDQIEWRNNPDEFQAWCDGKTGYPIVDAGMRELNRTGFMHNRARMITASFLTKHLLIDWRWGEAYFAEKLLDYDLASNNGGWQWASGSGCDASPYFRIFNPERQMKKFDPRSEYIKRWIPEYGGPDYVEKIVDHVFARQRALDMYRRGLNKPTMAEPEKKRLAKAFTTRTGGRK